MRWQNILWGEQMKILHICLGNYFIDNMSYQENMLTKQHKLMGYEVEVIASLQTYDSNGNYAFNLKSGTYINENGIQVTRIPYKKDTRFYHKIRSFKGLKAALEKANPDIIFIHNCQFIDITVVVEYLEKNRNIRVYVDNHADLTNSGTNIVSFFLHKTLWRYCAKRIEPYTTRFYGVLPVRVDFLKKMYRLPENKCSLLVMGADDELVREAAKESVRCRIRDQYHISKDDFLIITGGKIDNWKRQTLLLMKAVREIKNPKVKLLVFGSIIPELKSQILDLTDENRVIYVGWVKSDETYPLFASSDLAVFPGRHSVFWEQVTAQGIPMICKDLPRTHHIDLGGNVEFLYKDSVDEIKECIEKIVNDKEKYERMKSIAQSKGMKEFSYWEIARRAIE